MSDAADRSGFSVDTLRYYERIDLVTDVPRNSAGRRVYDDSHLAWLGWLRCLRDTGMPIQVMTRYAQLSRRPDTIDERLALLREHAAAVDEQIVRLQQQRHAIDEKITWHESVGRS